MPTHDEMVDQATSHANITLNAGAKQTLLTLIQARESAIQAARAALQADQQANLDPDSGEWSTLTPIQISRLVGYLT